MKDVLFLTYYFPPMAGPASQRCRKLAKYLPACGWRPVVVTVDRDPGEPYDDTLSDDVRDVEVVRVAPGALRGLLGNRFLRLAAHRLLTPDIQVGWLPALRRETDRLMGSRNIAAVLTSCPPFSLNQEGRRLRERWGRPWVTDLRDGWTLGAAFRPASPLHRRIHERLEAQACGSCDVLVANTPGLMTAERRKFPALEGKVLCVPNGYDPADFPPSAPVAAGSRPWRLAYTGTWYRREYPDGLFRLLAAFRSRAPGSPFELHYAGPHSREFGQGASRHGLTDVLKDHGRLPYAETLRLLASSDALLAALPGDERAGLWVPAKLYEYLAAGRPVIALFGKGDAADLVGRAGVVLSPDAPDLTERGAAALSDLFRRWKSGESPAPVDPGILREHQYPALAARLAEALDQAVATGPDRKKV